MSKRHTYRVIGIVRVSRVDGREGESFHSPDVQRQRIEDACQSRGWRLVGVREELDVSGGKPLAQRPGLSYAVEAIEAGQADIVLAAYLDRLTRDPNVRDAVIDRVETAGGEVFAADMGRQSNGTAVEQLTGTLASAVHRYVRRVAAERSHDAQVRAVARGVPPWPRVTVGYQRGEDGRYVRDPVTAPVVVKAFELRASGATVAEVRTFLQEHDIVLSVTGVRKLLRSRVVLGEIHFGDLVNLHAHEPIVVDRATWNRVQRMVVPSGRKTKSKRLLARLGVLRCASCGGRMSASRTGRDYAFYRCASQACDHPVTISAEPVERLVEDAVREALKDAEGRASAESNVREAEDARERAQADLDAALRAFAGLMDEPGAVERLGELREARDGAQARRDQLGGSRVVTVNAGADWDRLTLDERRALIRATVERVTVAPGRGPDRVSVQFVGQ